MTEITLEQAFQICQENKSTWLTRKSELAEAEREFQELFATGNDSDSRSLQMLRDIIDVKKWEVNRTAGCYIRAHEDMQRISIRNRLDDFMVSHGAKQAAALAPELMGYHGQHSNVKQCVCSIPCSICVKPSWSGWPEAKKLIIQHRTVNY